MSARVESNHRPGAYKTPALTSELLAASGVAIRADVGSDRPECIYSLVKEHEARIGRTPSAFARPVVCRAPTAQRKNPHQIDGVWCGLPKSALMFVFDAGSEDPLTSAEIITYQRPAASFRGFMGSSRPIPPMCAHAKTRTPAGLGQPAAKRVVDRCCILNRDIETSFTPATIHRTAATIGP